MYMEDTIWFILLVYVSYGVNLLIYMRRRLSISTIVSIHVSNCISLTYYIQLENNSYHKIIEKGLCENIYSRFPSRKSQGTNVTKDTLQKVLRALVCSVE